MSVNEQSAMALDRAFVYLMANPNGPFPVEMLPAIDELCTRQEHQPNVIDDAWLERYVETGARG